MTTEPTDVEIFVVAREAGLLPDNSHPAPETRAARKHSNAVQAFARAVLAKWGTPPAVAWEPIGYLYCGGSYGDELADWEIVADQHQCDKLNEHHGSLGKEAKLPIYTTPQPTQAQAGAVPLTDEQLLLLQFAASSLFHLFERWNKKEIQHYQLMDEMGQILEHVIRRTVVAHGIKGGQHGTE